MNHGNDHPPSSDPAPTAPSPVRVLAIVGSLRVESYNRMFLAEAEAHAPTGVDIVEWHDLRLVPPFNEDDEDDPGPTVTALRQAIQEADAVLIVTPEYNGSIPGQLKNALDWASRPFPDSVLRNKPAAVIGASPSPGGARRAQGETRAVLTRIGARVLDDGVELAHAYQQFDPAGQLLDTVTIRRLSVLIADLAAATSPDPTLALTSAAVSHS